MKSSSHYAHAVFINCPFDSRYRRLFRAIVFSIIDCGFIPRCALEISDSSVERLSKLFDLIASCQLGVHDISRTQLDSQHRLPRFNMALELGIFLGAKRFGPSKQKLKNCVILDSERYRFQKFISDLGGKDIAAHNNDSSEVIRIVRNWLGSFSKSLIPGAAKMIQKYDDFQAQLPLQCRTLHLVPAELTFVDFILLVEAWLEKYDEENE
ncbi:MAG: hypothetical protein ACFFBS_10445 [Promethearchaeota archaeon]